MQIVVNVHPCAKCGTENPLDFGLITSSEFTFRTSEYCLGCLRRAPRKECMGCRRHMERLRQSYVDVGEGEIEDWRLCRRCHKLIALAVNRHGLPDESGHPTSAVSWLAYEKHRLMIEHKNVRVRKWNELVNRFEGCEALLSRVDDVPTMKATFPLSEAENSTKVTPGDVRTSTPQI